MDTLERLYRLASSVAKALNDNNVQPVDEPYLGAVLLVVGKDDDSEEPIGASLNYDDATGQWEVMPQADMGSDVNH